MLSSEFCEHFTCVSVECADTRQARRRGGTGRGGHELDVVYWPGEYIAVSLRKHTLLRVTHLHARHTDHSHTKTRPFYMLMECGVDPG